MLLTNEFPQSHLEAFATGLSHGLGFYTLAVFSYVVKAKVT